MCDLTPILHVCTVILTLEKAKIRFTPNTLLKVLSHETIFCPIFKRFSICGTCKSNGQVFTLADFPFEFAAIFNFFYFSHYMYMLLIRLSNCNRTQPILIRHFDSTFAFSQCNFCGKCIKIKKLD